MNGPRHAVLAAAVAVVLGVSGYLSHAVLTTPSGSFEALTLYDPDDPREVAGSADDVFHAEVTAHTGRRTIAHVPSELYEVRVGRVFKGGLAGTVTITVPAGDPALEAGTKYVFTTAAWGNREREHAVLSDTRPLLAPDLGARVPDLPGEPVRTVGELWQWAVRHQIDVTPE
ncbi:hypothetical protein [Streptomyces sp. CAU 1734]|uniref:hypothetical protein n=1 Tax=Streptomyces sp. CAU 1734 TaxID=3140360 RepID=UPI003261380A